MRKTVLISALVASLFMVSGCDFFRKLAGRPTSSDIEAKRVLIAQQQRSHQQHLDSLKAVQKQISDSLAALDSLKNSLGAVVTTKPLPEETRAALSHRYYIIVGAFSSRENAENLRLKIEQKGYTATVISYRNGFSAVGVCPSDNLVEISGMFEKVKKESFCPSDAWILVNE